MKNRKLVIVAFVLVAALTLGIGYAAITNHLVVGGTSVVTKDTGNFKVIFTEVEKTTTEGFVSDLTATISTDPVAATLQSSKLVKEGDKIQAIFTVKNNSNGLDATLAAPTYTLSATNDSNVAVVKPEEYLDVNAVFAKSALAAGEETTMTVTITLLKTPVENLTFEYTVTSITTAVEKTTNAGQ